MINEKTTHDLMNTLKQVDRSDQLEEYLTESADQEFPSFADYFRSLPAVQNCSNTDLIRRSGIERTYFYQLINGTRSPGRDKVILLGLAAGLSVKEVQRALEMNRLGILYAKNRRDSILIFSLQNHLSTEDAQELLLSYQEKPLT